MHVQSSIVNKCFRASFLTTFYIFLSGLQVICGWESLENPVFFRLTDFCCHLLHQTLARTVSVGGTRGARFNLVKLPVQNRHEPVLTGSGSISLCSSLELPPLSICVCICFDVRLLLFQSHGISWDEYCASCLRSL